MLVHATMQGHTYYTIIMDVHKMFSRGSSDHEHDKFLTITEGLKLTIQD